MTVTDGRTGEPSVSVIIPVRDRRQLLERCLASLVPQVRGRGEIIVVDDGSTDGSGEVARAHSDAGEPVRVIDVPGIGAVNARMRGVAASRAPVLAFTDSDCVPAEAWLDAGLEAVGRGHDLVQGRTLPTRPAGRGQRSMWVTHEDGLYATCNLFVTGAAYDEVGGFDDRGGVRIGSRPGPVLRDLGFGEDTMLGWRVRRVGYRHTFCHDALVRHHVFRFDPTEHVVRSWQAGGFPGLVREVPELRRCFLRHRLFLGTTRRVPLYLALAALPLRRRRASVALTLFWIGVHAADVGRSESTWGGRAKALPAVLSGDVITGVSLLVASARTTTPVL